MSFYTLKHPQPALCAIPPPAVGSRASSSTDAAFFLAASSSPLLPSTPSAPWTPPGLAVIAFEDDEQRAQATGGGEQHKVEGREVAWKSASTLQKGDEIVQLECGGADSSSWLAWTVVGSRANGHRAVLLRIPFGDKNLAAGEAAGLSGHGPPAPALKLAVQPGDRPESVIAAASTAAETVVVVYQTPASGPKPSAAIRLAPGRGATTSVECNPHAPHLFSITLDSSLLFFDSRAPGDGPYAKPTLAIQAHGHATCHSYNPNVPHLVASGGRDGKARIWDIRTGEGCKEIVGGGHHLTAVEYHPTHDQLLLTSSTDGQVLLHDIGSLSYAGGAVSDSEGSESEDGADEPRRPHADALLATYDLYQDSVYRVAWARGAPWTFAACAWGSGGARIGGGEVPRQMSRPNTLATPSRLIEIAEIPGRGRGIVGASPTVSPGSLLLTEMPFAAVVDDAHLDSTCFFCFAQLLDQTTKLRCSACSFAHYCGRGCQRRDWTLGHKTECLGLKRRRPTTSVRLLVRVLERRVVERDLYEAGVGRMVANREQFTDDDIEAFGQMAMLVRAMVSPEAMADMDASELILLFCRFACNAMSVTAPASDLVNVGVAILPYSALMNHSCVPNAVLVYVKEADGSFRAQMRSIEAIPSGGEVYLSYIPVETMPRKKRQDGLRKQYFFDCTCNLCSLPVDPLDSLYCWKCVKHVEAPEHGSHAVCPICGAIIAELGLISTALGTAQALIDSSERDSSSDTPERIENALTRLDSLRALSPQHYMPTRLRTHLYDSLVARSMFAEAYLVSLVIGKALTPPIVSRSHPARTLRLLLTAKLAAYYFETRSAESGALNEARELAVAAMEGVRTAWGDGGFYRRCVAEIGFA